MPLNDERAAVLVPDAVDPSREVGDLAGGEDLAGSGLAAEPRRQVQRAAPVATLDRDGLAGIQADPDREWQLRLRERLLARSAAAGRRRRGSPRASRRRRRAPRPLAARGAFRREPPRSRARSSANFAASFAAASSPRSWVKRVYPRTSAIRNVRIWAPVDPPSPLEPSAPPGSATCGLWTVRSECGNYQRPNDIRSPKQGRSIALQSVCALNTLHSTRTFEGPPRRRGIGSEQDNDGTRSMAAGSTSRSRGSGPSAQRDSPDLPRGSSPRLAQQDPRGYLHERGASGVHGAYGTTIGYR